MNNNQSWLIAILVMVIFFFIFNIFPNWMTLYYGNKNKRRYQSDPIYKKMIDEKEEKEEEEKKRKREEEHIKSIKRERDRDELPF